MSEETQLFIVNLFFDDNTTEQIAYLIPDSHHEKAKNATQKGYENWFADDGNKTIEDFIDEAMKSFNIPHKKCQLTVENIDI